MGRYLLGIDNGGTVSKAAIYNESGNELAVSSRNTKMIIPKKGYTERYMEEFWQVNIEVIKEVIEKSGLNAEEIEAVSVTGHGNGVYLVGDDYKPVYNGIISTDSRAEEYVENWYKDGTFDKLFPKTMQSIWAGQPIPILAWFRDNKPSILNKVKWAFCCKDYIRFLLTGEAYAEITDISGTNVINVRDIEYDNEILKAFGLLEYKDIFPPIKSSTDICGYITSEVANLTGLSEGTKVAGGCFDIDACAIATEVTDEDKLCIIAGTWGINEYISSKPVVAKDLFMTSIYCMDNYWLQTEASPTSASNLEWFISKFLKLEKIKANENGSSIYDYCNQLVSDIKPEDCNILFLPYLYGNNVESDIDACLFGLNSYHSMAHIVRAIYEGIVFSHMIHIEKLFKYRNRPKVARISGGASKSSEWVQIFADILQIPIEVSKGSELGTLGAAICASVCADWYPTIQEAAQNMVEISYTCYPNKDNKDIYEKKYIRYKKLIEALKTV